MYRALLNLLMRLDGFSSFFEQKAYIYRQPNGEITLHGLCCLGADFVLVLQSGDLAELTAFIETSVDAEDAALKNAVRTCLLEPMKDSWAEPLLGPRSLEYLRSTPFA